MAENRSPAPLDAGSRAWTLLAAALALLPLLLQLVPSLAFGIGATALAIAALSWRRPMPALLRLALALAKLAAVLWVMGPRFGRDTG